MQLPAAFTESLDLRYRVRFTLETDHVGVRRGARGVHCTFCRRQLTL